MTVTNMEIDTGFGWSDDDLPPMTMHGALAAAKQLYGDDHVAFTYTDEGVDLTLADLERHGRRWAGILAGAGVELGDRVVVCLPGNSAWPQLQIACSMIGAVVVGINTRYRLHEIRHLIEHSRPEAVITMADWRGIPFTSLLDQALGEREAARISVSGDAGHGFTAAELGSSADEHEIFRRASQVDPSDLALIQFTSGSTSAPKGVMVSHDTLCRTAFQVMSAARYEPGEVVYSALPFYHVGGSICTGVGPLVSGARMVVPETFEAEASIHHALEYGCTAHQGHSAMFTMQIARAQELGLIEDLKLEKGWVAAPPSTLRRICDELGAPGIVSVYGMSEYGLISACSPRDSYEQRTETVGRPSPGTEVRIGGSAEVGEIEVRGSQLMMGYFEDPEATGAAMTQDGWFRTGDRARIDENGYLVFAGREKDMIKPGGENVSAAEIEEFLIDHPAIVAVAVIGVPDQRLGQVPAAVIEPLPGQEVSLEDVREFCRNRIAGFKTPRQVFIERPIPLLANGKLDKQSLRAKYGGEGKEDAGGGY